MKFTVVPNAKLRPQRCVALPQLGSQQEKGYFDTGQSVTGHELHSYISVRFVELAAEYLGFVSPDTQAHKDNEITNLEDRIAILEDELKAADRVLGPITALRSEGWRSVRQPGPKTGSKRTKDDE